MNKLHQMTAWNYLKRNYHTILEQPKLEAEITIDGNIETISIQGWRPTNEDQILVSRDGNNILAVVFDGHGGDWVANYCKEFYDKILFNTEEYKSGNYYDAFQHANILMDTQLFNETPKTMFNYARSNLTKKLFTYRHRTRKDGYNHSAQCGCTCCAVLITKDEIICSNIGDSKAIAFSNENLLSLNEEHKISNKHERERLDKNGFLIVNDRLNGSLNVVRGFGDFDEKNMNEIENENLQGVLNTPDILSYSRNLFTNVVIGCDGLWDCYNEHECQEQILNGISLDELAHNCINKSDAEISSQLFGYDNVSIISIKLE